MSTGSLNTTTEITAVSTIPKPPHIAYTTPNGMNFSACDKKKKHAM